MRTLLSVAFTFFITAAICQSKAVWKNEPSTNPPFGKVNPEAPEQTKDFAPMIGISECTSISRNPDGSWQEPVGMQWKFTYIMNGMAVQDETLKADGKHSGSIRQFNADSSRWYVHYYASGVASPKLRVWEGNLNADKIVLTLDQPAPNGMEGISRLTFYEMTQQSFKWIGEWVSKDGTIEYPFWKIECKKEVN